MKIEIAESLIYSWLRHYNKCILTQTNWEPSHFWEHHNQEKLENLYADFQCKFKEIGNYQTNGKIKVTELQKECSNNKESKDMSNCINTFVKAIKNIIKKEEKEKKKDKYKTQSTTISKGIINAFEEIFKNKDCDDLRKQVNKFCKKGVDNFLTQSEIDVVGIDNNGNVYAVDVAFHSQNLGYTRKEDDGKTTKNNVNNVTKKLIRMILCLYRYFYKDKDEKIKFNVFFATPKAQKKDITAINNNIDTIKGILEKNEINENFEIKLIAENFNEEILEHIKDVKETCSSTELFMRGYILYDSLISQENKKKISKKEN